MSKNLADYRKNYIKGELLESEIPENPLELFEVWFEEMEMVLKYKREKNDSTEVNAMTVSTIGLDGYPKSRIVLLKEFNEEGFLFYTNLGSDKAKSLMKNPNICLSFFWAGLERQVIIKGKAEKTLEEKAHIYFNSRPRESQLGAWASHQSSEIASREVLDKTLRELTLEFLGKPVPKPEFWGGFVVKPISFEFWQGRPNRLHDRILYTEERKNWNFKRLAP
ncbi:pyridoxamine 5'-phosphate oxidase [Gillisia sp. CAL575]|uniref:pyridoxamine 5'-phosphate oxidase n=1 Tax=Gillisia sp. CAL575 TaxID=985255 RepID=UPI000558EFAB|nr:pyridoxamine 5'-phosphate oxidase [Gillisia sp. CAL575]